MQLNSMGINVYHENNFKIDRPCGFGDNLLLIFLTDAIVWHGDKQEQVSPGSFIVYRQWSEEKYGAAGKEYANHYVHCNGDEELFDRIGLFTDRVGYLQNMEEIENILRLLCREQISDNELHYENEDLLLGLLFRKIAENQCERSAGRKDSRHIEALTRLRSEMYSMPGKYKGVSELAQEVNLSLSYFKALYHEYFGVSCYEDLLKARINSSKEFLKNGSMSIREIAQRCGYESDTCFMRCFKNREGMTPTDYRRKVTLVNLGDGVHGSKNEPR